MVRRPSAPNAASLSDSERRNLIERLNRRMEELRAFRPLSIRTRRSPEVVGLETAIAETLAAAFGTGTPRRARYNAAADLEPPLVLDMTPDWIAARGGGKRDHEDVNELRHQITERKQRALVLLGEAVRGLEEELESQVTTPAEDDQRHSRNPAIKSPKVFVVHGRDDGPREAVARFLERLGLQPVILHEQANRSRTVIEKIEEHSDVGFAVVLLTPDDEGNLKGEKPQPRARQNVLLELGYFIGKLKRENVCTLKVGELEIPSDWRGIIDEPFDSGRAWQQRLARELEVAGYKIDWNTVMRGS